MHDTSNICAIYSKFLFILWHLHNLNNVEIQKLKSNMILIYLPNSVICFAFLHFFKIVNEMQTHYSSLLTSYLQILLFFEAVLQSLCIYECNL